jgi:hypothetical protein
MGISLPMIYALGTVMFFNSFDTKTTVFVVGCSALCISLGVTAIWRSRRE